MLIKYIKSFLWRVAKCLSYIEEVRCLKVKKRKKYMTVICFPSGRTSWTECLIEILGILTVASPTPSKQARFKLRHVVNSWAVFTLLITTAYSSGLVSHLTCPAFSKPLDSIQALVEADIYWSHKYYPSMENLFDIQVGLSFLCLLKWYRFYRNLISALICGPLKHTLYIFFKINLLV